MGANSAIEWTHHTFNGWIGCTKVGPGCDFCYAERDMDHRRHMVRWGAGNPRHRTRPDNWRQPLRWNARASKAGERHRVFCSSLADVFDNEVDNQWRVDLWNVISETPSLDWLLLTKRIGNAAKMLPASIRNLPNVWLGATIVNQEEFDRDVPKLLSLPGIEGPRWLSMEPLLAPVNVSAHPVSWIVIGGESGPSARPMQIDWVDELIAQCDANGSKVFFKQGSAANWPSYKDFASFPTRFQRREFP